MIPFNHLEEADLQRALAASLQDKENSDDSDDSDDSVIEIRPVTQKRRPSPPPKKRRRLNPPPKKRRKPTPPPKKRRKPNPEPKRKSNKKQIDSETKRISKESQKFSEDIEDDYICEFLLRADPKELKAYLIRKSVGNANDMKYLMGIFPREKFGSQRWK